MTLQELISKISNLVGFKINQFTFPKVNPSDSAFWFDDLQNDKRYWVHLTESSIPKGTTLRLSEIDANAWQELAVKHIKTKVKKIKEPSAGRGRKKVEELI